MSPPCCSEPRVASPVPPPRHPHPHPSAQHRGSQGHPRTHLAPTTALPAPGPLGLEAPLHPPGHSGGVTSSASPLPSHLVVDQAGHHPPHSVGDAIINMTKTALLRPSLLPHPRSLALEQWFSSPAAHRNRLGDKTPVPGPHPHRLNPHVGSWPRVNT